MYGLWQTEINLMRKWWKLTFPWIFFGIYISSKVIFRFNYCQNSATILWKLVGLTIDWLIGCCLFVRSIDWLFVWLIYWLLVMRLIDLLIGCSIDWLITCYSIDWLITWLIDWLISCYSIDWFIDCLVDWLIDRSIIDYWRSSKEVRFHSFVAAIWNCITGNLTPTSFFP